MLNTIPEQAVPVIALIRAVGLSVTVTVKGGAFPQVVVTGVTV